MPGLQPGNAQADWNAAKATLAAVQTAADALAVALYNHEQACQTLVADGCTSFADLMRKKAQFVNSGYAVYASAPPVSVWARDPNVPRQMADINAIQSPLSTPTGVLLSSIGTTIVP